MKYLDPPYDKTAGFRLKDTHGGSPATRKMPEGTAIPDRDPDKFFAAKEGRGSGSSFITDNSTDQERNKFRDRLYSADRIKLCRGCGGIMKRSSRTVLSIPAGIGLVLLGLISMALYGYATNFYQAPWFIRFALPAVYYVGSIFFGGGILFFFIREKIWKCERCGEMSKR